MRTHEISRASKAMGATAPSMSIRERRAPLAAREDPLELEADRMADRVLAGGSAAIGSTNRAIQASAAAHAQPSPNSHPCIADAIAAPGDVLPTELRRDMERRFNHDFSGVRIHSDRQSEQSARELGANAYTAGRHIIFGAGQFAPHTHEGRRLLAHELTHVVQQASGSANGRIQMQASGKTADKPKGLRFKLIVQREMDALELRHEFVKQYYGATTEAQVQSKLLLWQVPERGTQPQDVARGYMMISVITRSQTDFEALDPNEQKQINEETDRRFWESTGYKPGQKLGTSPKDREMAEVWRGMRNAVLTEDSQRKQIAALPEDIKSVLFAGGKDAPTASPDDYVQILRIAQKLASLSPEKRQDYLARINASTSQLDQLERSVDDYLYFQAQREKQAVEHEAASKPLLGAEGIYDSYRRYKALKENARLSHANTAAKDPIEAAEAADYLDTRAAEAETALLAALKHRHFDSIAQFESALETYRISFRTQTVNLALDVLARYEHFLFEERRKLQAPGAAAAIAQGIAKTSAVAKYKEYHEQKGIEKNLRMGHEPKETWWIKPANEAKAAAAAAHAEAESEVIRGSGNDPLVAERGTDREKLAGLDAAGTQSYLFETLDDREADVRTARKEFKDDPDRVFKLQDLVDASMQVQGIDPTTIYGKVIADHIKDERKRHLLSQIAIGILAVALAFLVPGGGWLAAAALVANAGISSYQAYVAYKEYEQQERDYRLHFLSEEPSLFWVGVAIAAAALDLGVVTTVLVKQSASALKALEPSLVAFSKDGNLTTLAARIDAAEGLDLALKTAMKREAQASLAAERAMSDVAGRAYGMLPGVVDPGVVRSVFRALYYSVKRGFNTIAKLRADSKLMKAMGDITQMSGAERAELEAAFEEVKEMVKVAQGKGMDESSLLNFVDRWAINRTRPGFKPKLLEEMKLWRPLSAEQERALNALNAQKGAVKSLYEQKAAALEELKALRAKTTRTPEDVAEIRLLEKELSELDPKLVPGRVTGPHRGKIAEAEATLTQREAEAAKAELTLYDRLRAAAPSERAKELALRGVTTDQVGVIKTKPTGLNVDHIVSVREISDMEGFNKLLWKDQKAIVDMKENLVAMDSAANFSKGDRTWRSWNQAPAFYERATIDAMLKREAEVRRLILEEIQARLSKLQATSP